MRVLVTGAGRSGTNWATEIVRATDKFRFTKQVEDRRLFSRLWLPRRYGTKLATENIGFTWRNLHRLLQRYSDFLIVFVTRHPVDNCLSKIKRGQPVSDGGDGSNRMAPDATLEGSIAALKHNYSILMNLIEKYPDRTLHIKLERLINNTEEEVVRICNFVYCEPTLNSFEAFKYNRNNFQRRRYGIAIDISQVDMYKRWSCIYGGFFKNRKDDVDKLKSSLSNITLSLGYRLQ